MPMDAMPTEVPHLNATDRRVLGVLIEKGMTTPEYYPLTVNALIAGCNQKNNREPVTSLDEDSVMSALHDLEGRGLAASVIAETGRVNRWRQDLGRKFELNAVQLSVMGELLLRGAQSEGDLRGRASRMRPIETLEALRELLLQLLSKRLVVRLTPEGTSRGVRWTHTLGPSDQLDMLVANEARGLGAVAVAVPRAPPAPDVLARIEQLEARVARLEEELSRPDRSS
jgi:uncharacterized protein YceH (UPF0502 family)